MDTTKHIKVDFTEIQDTAYKGVRRTAVFMGLGLNAATDPKFKRYQLSEITHMQFIPEKVSDETVLHFKTEFGRWIVACGLRELIETFSVFLDKIHEACLLMAVSQGKMTHKLALEHHNSFLWKGFTEKMKTLHERFGVYSQYNDHLGTVQLVRNCYTHRRGIVGKADCGDSQQLELRWIGMDVYIETTDGDIINLNLPLQEGVCVEKGGTVKVKSAERKRSFQLGTVVDIPPKELAEICTLILWATNEITKSAFAYAKSIGIPNDNSLSASVPTQQDAATDTGAINSHEQDTGTSAT
jgi:hypothetical protein